MADKKACAPSDKKACAPSDKKVGTASSAVTPPARLMKIREMVSLIAAMTGENISEPVFEKLCSMLTDEPDIAEITAAMAKLTTA